MTSETYRPATLDDAPVEPSVRDLTEGETGYTFPWALIYCADGRVLIRGDYPLTRCRLGPSELPVGRLGGRLVVAGKLPPRSGGLSSAESAAHAIANWGAEPVYVEAR